MNKTVYFPDCRAILRGITLLFCVVLWQTVQSEELLDFASAVEEKRYYELIKEIRCPKCQNNNIADSNASVSEELRILVYQQLKQGRSDMEIRQFFSDRYGDFVLYDPPVRTNTMIIWAGPIVLLLVGAVLLITVIRRRQRTVVLPDPDQAEIDNRLAQLDEDLP